MSSKRPLIVAPHGDDEIIGCFELLKKNPIILYDSDCIDHARMEEIPLLKKYYKLEQIFDNGFINEFDSHKLTLYFPDPIYETHPKHRQWGHLGEKIARDGYDVVFYTTNMQAPYIHECKSFEQKKQLLDHVYCSQSSLWKYDHKYFLLEGRCKWIF